MHIGPSDHVGWLDDRKLLGKELGARLKAVYGARVPGRQKFVCLAPGVEIGRAHV